MGYGMFQDAIYQLESFGLTDVLLPFFLIFTVSFAVLTKAKVLGEKKNFHVIIALVMAFAVIIPHVTGRYPPGADVVDIINRALPNVSLIVVAILMVLLLIGMFGLSVEGGGGTIQGWIAILAFLVVIYIFGAAANLWNMPSRFSFLLRPDLQALIVVLLIFGLVVWFITKEDRPDKEGTLKKLGDTVSELFKK